MRTLFTCLLLAVCSVLSAAEFRIETRVFAAGDEEPVSESVTLFTSGTAYDYRDADDRVTIFRPGAANKPGRFVLLNTDKQTRTEIAGDRVAVAMTKLRRWASVHEDAFLRFTGDPKFDQSFDATSGELKLTSDQLSYRLVTMPVASPEAMTELRAFLDAFAQLHTLLEAGVPPGPRLLLNEALSEYEVVPIEVELYSGPIEGAPDLRAEHLVTWILSKQDRDRIEGSTRQLAEFQEVENSAFSRATRKLASEDSAPTK